MVITKCTYCGKEVEKEANQLKHYRNPFCNSSCAASYNNNIARAPKRQKEGEFRSCLNCGEEIYISKADIEKTKKGITTVRSNGKFCSNQCQGDHNWEIKKDQIRTNGIESLNHKGVHKTQTYDRILKALTIDDNPHGETGRACWHCGWEEENLFTKKGGKGRNSRFQSNIPTQLNHIDGDPLNNKLDNLEIVCPNCHSLGEYYGSRGKGGRGRKNRS